MYTIYVWEEKGREILEMEFHVLGGGGVGLLPYEGFKAHLANHQPLRIPRSCQSEWLKSYTSLHNCLLGLSFLFVVRYTYQHSHIRLLLLTTVFMQTTLYTMQISTYHILLLLLTEHIDAIMLSTTIPT